MATRTYKGSCHCGKVTFEADIDLEKPTSKCNCTQCWKSRAWAAGGKPSMLRLLTGKDDLTDYTRSDAVHFMFCKHCGIRVYGHGNLPEVGGEYLTVMVSTLDDVDPAALAAAPITYCDGLNNNWWNPPSETRHL